MIKKSYRKEKISIQNIGQQRFWFGLVVGILTAISLSFFFNYSREVLRFLTSISTDLLILNSKEFQFYNYFYSTLSSVLGLSITIWIWMSNPNHKRRKDKIYKQLSRTYSLLIFWLILWAITRFGHTLSFVVYGAWGYEDQLNLDEEYLLLFVLMPLVIFFQNWFIVRLVYRARNWIFISFVFCLFAAFCFNFITTVDQNKLNNAYYQRFEKDYHYIEQEISDAEEKYGIVFKPETIEILKKWHTESSVEQLMNLKSAFSLNRPVSMDTIILQKIVIRNYKIGKWKFYQRNSIGNWHYALPMDILKQINLTNSNENKTKELVQLLREQIELLNTPEIDWREYEYLTETERRRSFAAKYNVPDTLISQLKITIDSLKRIDKYKEFTVNLPKIKNDRID